MSGVSNNGEVSSPPADDLYTSNNNETVKVELPYAAAVPVTTDSGGVEQGNGTISGPAMYHQPDLAPGDGPETDALTGRPVTRQGTMGGTYSRQHCHNAIEFELHKLDVQGDKEDAVESRAKIIREMPATLHKKRELRNQYGKRKVKAVSGWKSFKYNTALKWKHFKEKMYDVVLTFEVWRASLKEVEGKFGTAVVSYFVFLKWMLFLNIYIFVLMFGFVIIPQVILGGGYIESTTCEAEYTSSVDQQCNTGNTGQCIIDFIGGTGWMEQTALFYGDYPPSFSNDNSTDITVFLDNVYILPLAYLLTSAGYFLLSLLLMVQYTAAGFKESLGNTEDYHFKYCNKIFAAWDYSMTDEKNAYLKHRSIHYILQTDLEEARLKLLRANRTTLKKCRLYLLRLILNVVVLAILGGAGYLIYYTTDLSVLHSNMPITTNAVGSLLIGYLPSITITILNGLVPMIFNVVVRFEDYSPQFEISMTLVRTVFLRLASLGVLFFSLFPQISCSETAEDTCGVCSAGDLKCWETYIGQEFYKLSITDFAAVVLVVLLWEFPRKIAAKYLHFGIVQTLGKMEFEIPKNVLAIVYSQALCWIGSFYCPFLPAISLVKCLVFFYLKKWSLLYNMVPSSRPFRASRSGIFFMVILLITFMGCIIPVGYSIGAIEPSRGCGPFRGQVTMWAVITTTIEQFNNFFEEVFKFIGSAAFVVPCIVVLLLILYYYHAIASAHNELVNRLKEQLIMEGRDKHFLLTRLHELEPNTKGHKKRHILPQKSQKTHPPKHPSQAWSGGGPMDAHPFSTQS
ncbi:transmembrane channel-like protein 7 [Patiria miniata]|uniref:TMC domain-containing protein n=1 Tax=Patiria miniata TaxID=46514 RepID=A0A914AJ98_PATMI|nr:transmembrane channel-like protein 7 [Patiria miniata]